MKKIVLSWIVCVLALVGLFAWISAQRTVGDRAADGEPLITADFTLVDGTSNTVRAKDLRGRYLLVFFGFTHCPDICPTTLLLLQNVLGQMGDSAKNVQPVFISVDPERDTPKAVGDYVGHFGKTMLGLTGTPEQVKAAADNFKVYYSKVEDRDSALGYVVDHSGFIYLIGPNGHYITHFPATVSESELKKELMTYVR